MEIITNKSKLQKLIEHLQPLSKEKHDFKIMFQEWECYKIKEEEGVCFCGTPIKKKFFITNCFTKEKTYVGSTCINKFIPIAHEYETFFNSYNENITETKVSRKLCDFLKQKNIINTKQHSILIRNKTVNYKKENSIELYMLYTKIHMGCQHKMDEYKILSEKIHKMNDCYKYWKAQDIKDEGKEFLKKVIEHRIVGNPISYEHRERFNKAYKLYRKADEYDPVLK